MSAAKDIDGGDRHCESGQHLIGAVKGRLPGPTLVVVASLHGNEPAGVYAARRVWAHLQRMDTALRGEVVLLAGNSRALSKSVRYIDTDLNRHWTSENLSAATSDSFPGSPKSEDLEMRELIEQFKRFAARARGEMYFLDLHTTSAVGASFATLGDTLRNRRFAMNFPTTLVLGLEEQLTGTMLEYVNNLGAVTLGFEAGQHDDKSSVDNHEALIWIALVVAGLLSPKDAPRFEASRALLANAGGGTRILEVRHRHAIEPRDEFEMKPGYENFQSVRRGQLLAQDHLGPVRAREGGMLLMPLYQKLGDDGFFLGRTVKPMWLKLSAVLRHLRIGDLAHLLPGVRRQSKDGASLVVNTRIARLLPLQVFHLLGFRKLHWSDNVLVVSRRRYDLSGPLKLEFGASDV